MSYGSITVFAVIGCLARPKESTVTTKFRMLFESHVMIGMAHKGTNRTDTSIFGVFASVTCVPVLFHKSFLGSIVGAIYSFDISILGTIVGEIYAFENFLRELRTPHIFHIQLNV